MTPIARYDAARDAVDALECAMNGPDGCPAAVRAVLGTHLVALADLCDMTPRALQDRFVRNAPDSMLCPSAAAEAAGKVHDPFDKSEHWTVVNLFGETAAMRLADLREAATAAALTDAATGVVQRLLPAESGPPSIGVSILSLARLFKVARRKMVALDTGVLVPGYPLLVLPRLRVKLALDHVALHMHGGGPDASFRGRISWEVAAPERVRFPATTLPFQLWPQEWTAAEFDDLPPRMPVQRVGPTARAVDQVPIYGPVQRVPPVCRPVLTIGWDDPGRRKGHFRFLGIQDVDVARGAIDGDIDRVCIAKTQPATGPSVVAAAPRKTKTTKVA